jgi:hypothetical protein
MTVAAGGRSAGCRLLLLLAEPRKQCYIKLAHAAVNAFAEAPPVFPCGLCISLNAQQQLSFDHQQYEPSPLVMLLSSEGLLSVCAFTDSERAESGMASVIIAPAPPATPQRFTAAAGTGASTAQQQGPVSALASGLASSFGSVAAGVRSVLGVAGGTDESTDDSTAAFGGARRLQSDFDSSAGATAAAAAQHDASSDSDIASESAIETDDDEYDEDVLSGENCVTAAAATKQQ